MSRSALWRACFLAEQALAEQQRHQICESVSASPAPRSLMALSVPIIPDAHEERVGRRAVSIGPVIEDDRLIGLLVRMHGIAMVFTLDLEDGEELPDKEILRPDMLDLIGVERTSRIYLSQAMRPACAHIVQIRLGRSIRGHRSTQPVS